ncbi:hypothetical protein EDB19DRAFT_1683403 [Suillus lakei]|nr:hypothetical protein EDB19DRAFT_1683403 [Suillus lakei]
MTPRASPSVAPPDRRPTKRPRLSKSTHRVLNVWAQLAERYNKRLDEDDIVDLYSGTIISDRGVLKNGKDYDFGHFTPDDSQDDQDQEQEQEQGEQDQDDDIDELDTLPVRRVSGTDGTMASTSELLRAVPPLSATTDADDLNDFLEAEKRRKELLGDEDGEDDLSMEELAALREALHESEEDEEQPETVHADITEDESEDELNSIWQHDEASAVYHIARNEPEQDVAEGEQKILEFADSDEEFAALLERPPRAGKRKRNSSPFSPQRKSSLSSSQRTPSPSSPPRTSFPSSSQLPSSSSSPLRKPLPSSPLRKPAPSSSLRKPLPSSPLRKPSPSPPRRKALPSFPLRNPSLSSPLRRSSPASSHRCTSSESTLVPDTPSTTASTRFASRTPQTQVHPFATPSINPTQPPQLLLYQAMQQLSYALSATMLTYGSPHMPPPPTGPWGAYPPGFAHPWGQPETSEAPLSFKLGDDEQDDDRPDDESTLADHDAGVVENGRRRRRSTSPIGSRRDARKIERRKSARFYEEKYQDQRIVARGRTPGIPSPTRSIKGSTSTNKKKGKAKRKS